MNKTEMSVGKQIKYEYTINGALFIAAGIFYIFDNMPCKILFIVCACSSIYALTKSTTSPKEAKDEMAKQNLSRAKACTLTRSHLILCIIMLFLFFFLDFPISDTINWKKLILPFLFIVSGFMELSTGYQFKKFEEE